MVQKTKSGRVLKAGKIGNVVRSLTVLNVDVSKLEERLSKGRKLGTGDTSFCVIDITCCIIDCSRCTPQEMDIYSNPENFLEGFMFKLPEQVKNPEAPVYYVPEMSARKAFSMGHHGSVKVPGGAIEARMLGIAGEVFPNRTLNKQRIAPTAAVIALSPTKALRAKAPKSVS